MPGLGTAHLMAHRNAEALPLPQRAVQEAPKFLPTHRMLVHALTCLGLLEELIASRWRSWKNDGRQSWPQAFPSDHQPPHLAESCV